MTFMKVIILFLSIGLIVAQSPPPGFGPPPDYCRPLEKCNLKCPYRFRFGADGCEICQCRSSPCLNETAILPNIECDRTATGPKCPSTHDCVVPREDRPPPPPTSGTRPPPTQPPLTARGVCCIHVDFQAMGFSGPPPYKH